MAQVSIFKLSGLTCGACEKLVGKRLKTINGVEDVKVSLHDAQASVFASRAISESEVALALEDTHYEIINK